MFAHTKDTHSRGGCDGCNGANGDRLLGVAQVSRAVRACHDTCEHERHCPRSDLAGFKRPALPGCPSALPVTDGKYIPTSKVKKLVMSART